MPDGMPHTNEIRATPGGEAGNPVEQHFAWVRRLAHSLVSDPHVADDLAQDTYLVALERPPRHHGNLRGWLARVLRSLLVQQHRKRAPVSVDPEVTEAAARTEPAAADVVARASTTRAVVDAVLALEEPSRSVVLMRYLEGLPPRTIAERLGIPVSTVHTRIQRGLARLRSELDHSHGGDRQAWLGALAPIALGPAAVSSATVAGTSATATTAAAAVTNPLPWILTMKTSLAITGVTVTLAAAAVTWLAWPSDATTTPRASDSVVAGDGPNDHDALTDEIEPGEQAPATERTEVATAPREDLQREPATPTWPVSGLVLDANGRPLPDFSVSRGPEGATVETGADGTFTLTDDGTRPRSLAVREEGWTIALGVQLHDLATDADGATAVLIAAPSIDLGGRVVDASGEPIADATIEWQLPSTFRSRFALPLDRSRRNERLVRSADDGRFSLSGLPAVSGATLSVSHRRYTDVQRPAPMADDTALRLVLAAPTTADATSLSGRVLLADGSPAVGALVATYNHTTETGPDGTFVLDLGETPAHAADRINAQLTALLPHHQPAVERRPDDGWPEYVTLQLGPAPLSISGTVVDESGDPVSDVRVWAIDPIVLGRVGGGMVSAEGLVSDHLTPEQAFAAYRALDSDDERRDFVRNTPSAMWPWVRTDEHGAFDLGGLLAGRPYTLRLMHEPTMTTLDTQPIEAGGSGLRFVLPTEDRWTTLSGTIVTTNGLPVAGATVGMAADAIRLAIPDRGASVRHYSRDNATVRTDDEGRFTLRHVPRTHVYLRVDGDSILPIEYGRGSETDGLARLVGGVDDDVRIVVSSRCHVQLQLRKPGEATGFSVLDASGRELNIDHFEANGRTTLDVFPFDEHGHTPVLTVAETATVLVLHKDG